MLVYTNSWRSTALTLFAAVLSLLFLLAGVASACPQHHAGHNQAHTSIPHNESTVQRQAPASVAHDRASLAIHDNGGMQAECYRMHHSGASDCSTCCGIGEIAAQRPQEISVTGEKPAQVFVPSALTVAPTPETAAPPHLFAARSWHAYVSQSGTSRLVAISRRLRL